MLKVETTAEVKYTCFLSGDKEKMVRDCAENHGLSLKESVDKIRRSGIGYELELYKDSTESDFSTTEIVSVEEQDENV